MRKSVLVIYALLTVVIASNAQTDDERRLVFIMMDGMRWQDVFDGADTAYVNNRKFAVNPKGLSELFVRDTQEERREALMPFLWEMIRSKGLVIGNRWAECPMSVENSHWFSYPGYSENLCGCTDDHRITSNAPIDNPNINVLEVINQTPAYRGSVMAYASWGTVDNILNTRRNGIPCVAGYHGRAEEPHLTEQMRFMNTMKDMMVEEWGDATRDMFTGMYALEAMRHLHPKVLYVSLDETDEYGHTGRYDHYLMAAHADDRIISMLWKQAQSDPFYRDRTTFVIATDHGRGMGDHWTDHGAITERSGETWLAAFGPGIPHLGEVVGRGPFQNTQIAATIACLLGVTFQPAGQEVGPPLFFVE